MRDLYEKSGDTFGKYTVPILWDKVKASSCRGWLGSWWPGCAPCHGGIALWAGGTPAEPGLCSRCTLLGWRPCPFGTVRSRLPCLAHMPSHQYVPGCLAGALQGCIVNNESSEIVRMFNSEFNHLAGNPDLDL